MTLPVYPSSISMSQVNTELGKSSTVSVALNDSDVRTLAQVTTPGSQISMYDLFGKSSAKGTITEINSILETPLNYSRAISMNYDGTKLAFSKSGAVLIYTRSGSTWTLAQTISNAASQFGYTTSLSHDGNTLLITAFSGGGVGYVYNWNGSSYVLGTTLTIPNNGYVAVMNSVGDTIFSACPAYSAPGYTNSGRAVIFKKVSGTWDSGTLVYPPVNYNSLGWYPLTISGDGNWKFIAGNGTTSGMNLVSVFDASNNRYDFPGTATPNNISSRFVCDYTATNVIHTISSGSYLTCKRYTRSGTTFTLQETMDVPSGYTNNGFGITGLGMSKFGDYFMAGQPSYKPDGVNMYGAFWTYNSFVQKAYKAGSQSTALVFGGTPSVLTGGSMSGDGGLVWQLNTLSNGTINGIRFFTYT